MATGALTYDRVISTIGELSDNQLRILYNQGGLDPTVPINSKVLKSEIAGEESLEDVMKLLIEKEFFTWEEDINMYNLNEDHEVVEEDVRLYKTTSYANEFCKLLTNMGNVAAKLAGLNKV